MGKLFEQSFVQPLEVGAGAFDGEGTGRGVEGEHAVRREDVFRLLVDAASVPVYFVTATDRGGDAGVPAVKEGLAG